LRFEMSSLNSLNTDIIDNCIKWGKKKTELAQLLKLVQN
jgi:hypothetical protein